MKLAIVGSSKVDPSLVIGMRNKIESTLANFPNDTVIISGGADGVDTIGIDVAKHMGFKTEIFPPDNNSWESYKKRNLLIAEACDKLYCFALPYTKVKCYHHDKPENHERTAGCYTLRKAKELLKPTELFIIPFNEDMLKLNERIIEYSNEQTNSILTLVVNLHWDLVREMLNVWTEKDLYNPELEWQEDKIKMAKKLTDDLQELESIVKGVPIV